MRIPRPIGTTELNRSNPRKTKTHLINHYINSNGHYLGEVVDIDTLSYYLGIKKSEIVKKLHRQTIKTLTTINPESNLQLQESLVALSLHHLLEDKQETKHQLNVLKKAQGNDYVPFVSTALNQALKVNLDSTKQIMDFLKNTYNNIFEEAEHEMIFDPTSGKNITRREFIKLYGKKELDKILKYGNNVIEVEGVTTTDSDLGSPDSMITVEKALKLLQNHNTLELPEKNIENFLDIEEIRSLPVIDPRKTENNIKHTPKIVEPNKEKTHIDRRANELNIDLSIDQY